MLWVLSINGDLACPGKRWKVARWNVRWHCWAGIQGRRRQTSATLQTENQSPEQGSWEARHSLEMFPSLEWLNIQVLSPPLCILKRRLVWVCWCTFWRYSCNFYLPFLLLLLLFWWWVLCRLNCTYINLYNLIQPLLWSMNYCESDKHDCKLVLVSVVDFFFNQHFMSIDVFSILFDMCSLFSGSGCWCKRLERYDWLLCWKARGRVNPNY